MENIMLHVASCEQAKELLNLKFGNRYVGKEQIALADVVNRVLAQSIVAKEDVPGFDRSTVDGFAVHAADTFGSSESIPALLRNIGEVTMGKSCVLKCERGECVAIPTGGQLPQDADAVVMMEATEDYGDGLVGITKPVGPGQNVIYRHDDVSFGEEIYSCGKRLKTTDIGALAALGVTEVLVSKRPIVGILSTGDEVVPFDVTPRIGQVRDINSVLLSASVTRTGALPRRYGICSDDDDMLQVRISAMARECDVIFLSGGSSVGAKDALKRSVEALGEVYLHGIAVKPGKPTLFGEVNGKPLIGFPGHPAAVYFIYDLFADPLLRGMMGEIITLPPPCYKAKLTNTIPSNHGRQEYIAVSLTTEEGLLTADPLMSKSGLITQFTRADGYIEVPRDCEGFSEGDWVNVIAL
jgi:molybdopterin molybdotransferase